MSNTTTTPEATMTRTRCFQSVRTHWTIVTDADGHTVTRRPIADENHPVPYSAESFRAEQIVIESGMLAAVVTNGVVLRTRAFWV